MGKNHASQYANFGSLQNKVEKAENRFKNRQAQEKGILITPYKYSFYSYDSLSVNVPAL